jgi:hypothetical protein
VTGVQTCALPIWETYGDAVETASGSDWFYERLARVASFQTTDEANDALFVKSSTQEGLSEIAKAVNDAGFMEDALPSLVKIANMDAIGEGYSERLASRAREEVRSYPVEIRSLLMDGNRFANQMQYERNQSFDTTPAYRMNDDLMGVFKDRNIPQGIKDIIGSRLATADTLSIVAGELAQAIEENGHANETVEVLERNLAEKLAELDAFKEASEDDVARRTDEKTMLEEDVKRLELSIKAMEAKATAEQCVRDMNSAVKTISQLSRMTANADAKLNKSLSYASDSLLNYSERKKSDHSISKEVYDDLSEDLRKRFRQDSERFVPVKNHYDLTYKDMMSMKEEVADMKAFARETLRQRKNAEKVEVDSMRRSAFDDVISSDMDSDGFREYYEEENRKAEERQRQEWEKKQRKDEKEGRPTEEFVFKPLDKDKAYLSYERAQLAPGSMKYNKRKNVVFRAKDLADTQLLTPRRVMERISPVVKAMVFGGVYDGREYEGLYHVRDRYLKASQERQRMFHEKMVELGLSDEKSSGLKMVGNRFKTAWKAEFSKHTFDDTYTNGEALGIYIYSRSELGLKKLTSEYGNQLSVERIGEITGNLDDKYKALGDWMIQDASSRFGAISRAFLETENKLMDMRDNYFPLIGAGGVLSSYEISLDGSQNMSDVPEHRFTRMTTGGDYALELDVVSGFERLVERQERYIAGASYYKRMGRLLNPKGGRLYDMIDVAKGKKYADFIKNFLEETANGNSYADDVQDVIGRYRRNLVVARLAFAPLTIIKQLSAWFYGLHGDASKYLVSETWNYLKNRERMSEFIYERSPQMKAMTYSPDAELVHAMNADGRYQGVLKQVGEIGLMPMEFMDRSIKNMLWLGKYKQYQDELSQTMTDSALVDREASRMATEYILETQSGGTKQDNAMIYNCKEGLLKMSLMFTSQMNKQYNMLRDIPKFFSQKKYWAFASSIASIAFSTILVTFLGGGFLPDDDEQWFWQEDGFLNGLKSLGLDLLPELAGNVPLVGNRLSELMQGYRYDTDGFPMLSETVGLGKAISSKDWERIVDKSITFMQGAMESTGLPVVVPRATRSVVNAVREDDGWELLGIVNASWRDFFAD